MDKQRAKDIIACRCAQELKDGYVVNLGIGIPTQCARYFPEGVDITLHAELGLIGQGPAPTPEQADPLHVVDASGSEGRDPLEDFRIINGELAKYGEPEGRPQLVVLNKCDLIYEDGEIQRLKQAFEAMGYEAFPVSAAQNRGFDALLDRVVQLLGELPPPRVFEAEEAEESHVLPDDGFTIRRENNTFYVEGAAMQRFVDSVNFDDEESLNWFHRTLRDRGIIQALRDKGAGEGSTVSIGDMEFDFIE